MAPAMTTTPVTPSTAEVAAAHVLGGGNTSHIMYLAASAVLYITASVSLIGVNKSLMSEARFPHARVLVMWHMAACTVFCWVLYALCPRFFPGVQRVPGRELQLLKGAIPIGALYSVALCCSNNAFKFSGLAFLQFMKESNVMWVFLLSCFAGLQVPNRQRFTVICCLLISTTISLHMDTHFVWLGFAFQAVGLLCDSSKVVIGEFLLRGCSLDLDPLTYTMFIAPTCFLFLAPWGLYDMWVSADLIFVDLQVWWHLVLVSMVVAIVLNLAIANGIKCFSAVGYVLCGVTKDILIVVVSASFGGERVLLLQGVSFSFTLMCIIMWVLLSAAPDSTPVLVFEALLGVQRTEKSPLLQWGCEDAPKQFEGESGVRAV